MVLTLNEKMTSLVDVIEKRIKGDEKHLPLMLRSVYKPMCSTIRMLLAMMPEETLETQAEHAHIIYEALFCEYASREDFDSAMSELLHVWN